MTHALRNVVLERCNFFKECFFTYAQSLVTYITTDHRKRAAVAWTPSQHYRRSPRVLKPPAVPAYPLKRYFGWQRPIIQCNLRKPLLGLKALIRSHRQQTPENVNMVHVLDLWGEMATLDELQTVISDEEHQSDGEEKGSRKSSECESIILDTLFEREVPTTSDTASSN